VVYLGYTELVGAVVVASVSTVVALVDTADAVNLYFAADDHAVLVIAVEAQVTGDFPVGYIVVVVVAVAAAMIVLEESRNRYSELCHQVVVESYR